MKTFDAHRFIINFLKITQMGDVFILKLRLIQFSTKAKPG
jgi:hypothetical protein